jgi:hypothetical protein
MARSSGDISTINRAEAAIANLYIYICIHMAAPISPLNRFLPSTAPLWYPRATQSGRLRLSSVGEVGLCGC